MSPSVPEDPLADYLRLRSVVHDRVTGLPAYCAILEDVRGMLDHRRRIGLLHFDLANLDMVESLYGWQVFDRILDRAASVLTSCLGAELPRDALLAINAVAGDRFLVFVPHTLDGREVDGAWLARLSATVCRKLDAAFETDDFSGLGPRLQVREGHAFISEDPFYRFERRVHAAIEDARTSSARWDSRREMSWAAELKRIIKDAEVSAVFQPVVELSTLEVLGYEAFVRGPKDSLFEMPAAMFALSETVGVASDLDRLCRRTALAQAGEVARRGKVFLNVLAGGLEDPDWDHGEVADLLHRVSLSEADLVIEISERSADADPDRLASACVALKALGFGLAVDDVGTGYSSLATLERVQPDYLKVDLSVVRDVHLSLLKQELVASIVRIGERLGCELIAEGVEREEEATVLRQVGARYGQGFLYAGPSPSASAVRSLRTGERGGA